MPVISTLLHICLFFAKVPDLCSQCSIYIKPYQNQYKSLYVLLYMKHPESSPSAKISMVVLMCNFLPSLWYYRMFEYLLSDITERVEIFNNPYFNQFTFEVLKPEEFYFPYNLGLDDCFNK